jgi:hypothetical protein
VKRLLLWAFGVAIWLACFYILFAKPFGVLRAHAANIPQRQEALALATDGWCEHDWQGLASTHCPN